MHSAGITSMLGRISRRLLLAPTYARHSQVLRTIVRRTTPRRLYNLLLTEMEYRLRRTRVHGRPYILVVDPTNVCNLRCPLCPTGLLQHDRRRQLMSWGTFTQVVDTMAPWAYKINLFNWGEPLLHSHIFDMIRYASERNLASSLSSNLSLEISDENIDELITSGLEFICLSIDGVTQDSYSTYRRRGNLELVLRNVRRLAQRKRALDSATPVLEWQFIPMKHNEHEVGEARRLAKEIGVDRFRVIPVGLPFDSPEPQQLRETWFPLSVRDGRIGESGAEQDITSNDQARTACYFLYRYLVVNPDGRLSPCCVVSGERNDFGALRQTEPFTETWNNAMFRSARAHYRSDGDVEMATVCDRCELFAKRAKSHPAELAEH